MNEKELKAAEYALGTQSQSERAAIEQERLLDSELDAFITTWELKLAPMLANFESETPPQYILQQLQKELAMAAQLEPQESKLAAEQAVVDAHSEVVLLQRKLKRWQRASFTGYAMAATLLAAVVFNSVVVEPTAPPPFVAVFQKDDAQPAFLMSVDLKTRTLKVQSVTAEGLTGETYQLWIKADELGPSPRSLGLLSSIEKPMVKALDQFTPELIQSALFGISVEPMGGSPTGVPTGPAIHGQLYSVEI
ncbi:anti-sigma factor [Halioxenophilus aromaticivorans]|uniref:Anti-sigma factor n=1 Tax=Halioxenophilus aromaticivorans TaxID=1306992 RepID=A0AAV3U4W3_9ALTE